MFQKKYEAVNITLLFDSKDLPREQFAGLGYVLRCDQRREEVNSRDELQYRAMLSYPSVSANVHSEDI